ncbi:MAG: response regulator, partial [Arenimonas sp.]
GAIGPRECNVCQAFARIDNGGSSYIFIARLHQDRLMSGDSSLIGRTGSELVPNLSLPKVGIASEKQASSSESAIKSDTPNARLFSANSHSKRTAVLVVDDHPINRMVIVGQLITLGYEAEEAEGGIEALSLWESGRFDLVFTDCNMPEMSGYELSRRIREKESASELQRIPIIACTATTLEATVRDCLDAGMDDHITKPTDLLQLQKKLQQWLGLPVENSMATANAFTPSVDEDVLQKLTRRDPATTQRVLAKFRRVNDADVIRLLQAVDELDYSSIVQTAHRIRGACGLIGATRLDGVCTLIEQAGLISDGAAIALQLKEFHRELEQLNEYLGTEQS